MILYHVTTEKKAKLYNQSKCIHSPVRGFDTLQGAMAWAIKVGRKVIYQLEAPAPYKLPDHHNAYGTAYWNDGDITNFKCVFSAEGDA